MLRKISEEEKRSRALNPEELCYYCSEDVFSFRDTSELEGLKGEMIGQKRAEQALQFGLEMKSEGYHLFLSGPTGTGKTTYAVKKTKERAAQEPVPNDWCYVYNFQNPDQPLAISLPPGQGQKFRQAMEQLVREMEAALRRQFESDEYHRQYTELMKTFEDKANQVWKVLEMSARQMNMAVERTPTGIATIPLMSNGRPFSPEQFEMLPEAQKSVFHLNRKKLEKMIDDSLRQINQIRKEAREALKSLEEETAAYAIRHLFEEVKAAFDHEKIRRYLYDMQADVINHHHYFHREPDMPKETAPGNGPSQDPRSRYKVNLIVDRSNAQGAPVIVETNPTYFNLFGKTEFKGGYGHLTSDYSLIKPGSLHLANGGYLIMQAADLLSHPLSWLGIKRALKSGQIRIEHPAEENIWLAPTGLRPESIPLNVKIILIGTPDIYHLLYNYDEVFRKYFKVKVEFDGEMDRTPENMLQLARFIRSYTQEKELLPFSREAVMGMVDYSSRLAGHRQKLSTRFNQLIELLVEAELFARQDGAARVEEGHVRKALQAKEHRSGLIKEKVLERILDGTIMVDTQGERVGQINGLSVSKIGDLTFGQPHRITARTFVGRRGVINVERETAMSGQIHSKGVLILSGYLAGEFAQKHPLSMSATLVFEQTYSMVDGDSASSTELYALLSSLSRLPIDQGIAVTGSVNQFGEIQPIGGVNEKIEGFFYVCQAQGLTGKQGVIIPYQNVANLFLADEVIEAVKAGQFHIWPIKNIKEGIEILTGVEAGDGPPYPPGTVYALVEERLAEMGRRSATVQSEA